jgi:thiol-disulfide isomerase/thioredoxin
MRLPTPNAVAAIGTLLIIAVGIQACNGGFAPLGPAGASGSPTSNRQPVPADVLRGVTTVSDSTFASVGTGDVPNPFTANGGLSGNPTVPILRDSAGKPMVLYVGAEYCPYCAAERWAIVVALSRFGSFSNLRIISSSSSDVYPNTPTFTFYQSAYTSPFLTFQGVEVQDRNEAPLQSMTSEQSQLFTRYNPSGSFPFLDFGNQYIAIGASYSIIVLTDQDWHTIAAQLNNPNSAVTQSILGTTNYMTAAICQITGNQPANICSTSPIHVIDKTIGKPAGN